jgi:putative membrane protein
MNHDSDSVPGQGTGRIRRAHSNLLVYYALCSLMVGPFFPLLLLPLFFKYRSLRYVFDAQGVSMRWGILFRREISLNYSRIQDIHLASNIVERWLGLGRVLVQTASGSSGAEMTIEGLQDFEEIRDELYTRMRGARRGRARVGPAQPQPGATASLAAPPGGAELALALRSVASELAAVRAALERAPGGGAQPPAPPEPRS